jgi:seryl-tRNA synthetase
MIDIKKIRAKPDYIKNLLLKRSAKLSSVLDRLILKDEAYRAQISEKEQLESERNALSKAVGMKKSKQEDATNEMSQLAELKEKLKSLTESEPKMVEELDFILSSIPNVPDEATPEGADENDNQEIYTWGEKPVFDFTPKEHHELGLENGFFDFERGVKLSKSRFTLLKGEGAKLERALGNLMLDLATAAGFMECSPPLMCNSEAFKGVGQFPKFKEDVFKIAEEDLYLISTAEVPLTNIHQDEILPETDLPVRYTALTPCFRSEAGSAGRDVRGIIRQHQFYKVELVTIATPEQAQKEHELLTKCAEEVLRTLNLPYRKVLLCAGDMGFSAAKCYDLEVWFPGQNAYREISSCSWFTDFQARRAKIRFRPEKSAAKKSKPELVHTINGSGLAVGRTLAAVLENYQQADGSINYPEVLKKYLN